MDESLLTCSLERLATFAYIGLTEAFDTDLRQLSDLMGIDIPRLQQNRSPNTAKRSLDLTAALLLQIEKLNRMDAVLYAYANMLRGEANWVDR